MEPSALHEGRCSVSQGPFTRIVILLAFTALLLTACAPSIEQLHEDRDVAGLAEVLVTDYDAEARAAAATALGDIGAVEATPALVRSLGDPDPDVRTAVAQSLGEVGDERAVVPLLDASYDEDQAVADEALWAATDVLASMPEGEAVQLLLDAMADPEADVVVAAEEQLEYLLTELDPATAGEAVIGADAADEWLTVALGVGEDELSVETKLLGLQIDPPDSFDAPAQALCDAGTPIAGARSYEDSEAFHPAVVVGPNPWPAESGTWTPTALRFLELVVSVEDVAWEQLEVCSGYVFDDSPDSAEIIRERGEQTVRVLRASDGSVVEEQSFTGSDPRPCEEEEMFTDAEVAEGKRLRGDDPDLAEAVEWLEALVHPPRR